MGSTNRYLSIAILLLIFGFVFPQRTAESALRRNSATITYSLNNQVALRYLRFNPFSLTTSPALPSVAASQAEPTTAANFSRMEESAPERDNGARDMTLFCEDPPVTERPPIRIPYHPSLRSPYIP